MDSKVGHVVENLRGVEGVGVMWVCSCLERCWGGGICWVMTGLVREEDGMMGLREGIPEGHRVRWKVGSRDG
jgi:hypothetical protein